MSNVLAMHEYRTRQHESRAARYRTLKAMADAMRVTTLADMTEIDAMLVRYRERHGIQDVSNG